MPDSQRAYVVPGSSSIVTKAQLPSSFGVASYFLFFRFGAKRTDHFLLFVGSRILSMIPAPSGYSM